MDWLSHNSRPVSSLPQIVRSNTTPPKLNNVGSSVLTKPVLTNSASEFMPRVINSSSSSPNFLNSFPSVSSPTMFAPMPKKLDEVETIPNHISSETCSPIQSITNSPVLQDKLRKSPIMAPYQENVGGTTYFYQYTSPTSENCHQNEVNVSPVVSNDYICPVKPESSFFSNESIRNDILNRNVLTLLQPDLQQYPDLPQEVDSYHELFPLEPIPNQALHKAHLGYQASMYKATHMKSGVRYSLRRIHGFRLQNTKCMAVVELWKKLSHSNIVQLREVFTTKAFGDNSLIFVYDYYPGSETLLNKHFSHDQPGYADPFINDTSTPRPYSYQKNNILRHQQNNKLPEPLIWSYIIQLTSALRVIHSSSLACRSLDPTKIILTSKNRLRLSCLGVLDVIASQDAANAGASPSHPLLTHHRQQEDLTALGKLVLALACKSTAAVQRDNVATALDTVARSYTADLRNLVVYLLSGQRRSVADLMPMIGARFYTQLDNFHNQIDILDSELSKEVQNGRLFRLMTKLATINERPEFNMETTWSETGDRYMLKLFRDYVFHQVTEGGQPWIDMAHIVQCLNKLDTGSPEKICLMSRDEQSILVVSYAELKHCLEQSFQDLYDASLMQHDLSNVEDKL